MNDTYSPERFAISSAVKTPKKDGYLAADSDNLYIFEGQNLKTKIQLSQINKVKLQYGLMFIYTKGWLIFEKTTNISFAINSKSLSGNSSDEQDVKHQEAEFDKWQKFFESHNVKVIRASLVYALFGR